MSSVPSVLMPALPFVFFTNELHVLPSATLQNGHPPSAIQITKQFFQEQIEDLRTEFFQVQSMGSATAEEWIKGLDGRGKEWRSDVGRWEKWGAGGGIARMRGVEQSAVPTRTATPSTTGIMITHNPHPTNADNPAFLPNNTLHLPAQLQSQIHQTPQPIHTAFRKSRLVPKSMIVRVHLTHY